MALLSEQLSYFKESRRMPVPQRENTPSGILLADGLDKKDLRVLDTLRDNGCVVFMHGSGMTAGKLSETSDIDFAVIGSIPQTPTEILQKHVIGLDEEKQSEIDYVSFSTRASNGRKISIHLENPEFRSTYPDKSTATEYRDGNNKKQAGKTSYVMGGADTKGTLYMMHVTCAQNEYNDGILTTTPQTGIVKIPHRDSDEQREKSLSNFIIKPIASIDTKQRIVHTPTLPDEILIFGLELNKMTEDAPIDPHDRFGKEVFVDKPLVRSLRKIEEYTDSDPILLFSQSVYAREQVRADRKGKENNSHSFVLSLSEKLHKIY